MPRPKQQQHQQGQQQQQQQQQKQQHRKESFGMRFPKRTAGAMGILFLLYLLALVTHRGFLTPASTPTMHGDVTNVVQIDGAMPTKNWSNREHTEDAALEEFMIVNPEADLPNQGRKVQGQTREEVSVDAGTRSQHYGEIQRERQRWLRNEAQKLRDTNDARTGEAASESAKEHTGLVITSHDTIGGRDSVRGTNNSTARAQSQPESRGSNGVSLEQPQESESSSDTADVKTGTGSRDEEGGTEERRLVEEEQIFRKLSFSTQQEGAKGKMLRSASKGSVRGPDERLLWVESRDRDILTGTIAIKGADRFPARSTRDGLSGHGARGMAVEHNEEFDDVVDRKKMDVMLALAANRNVMNEAKNREEGREMGELVGAESLKENGFNNAVIAQHTADERARRMEYGAELWGATYVPPIEPGRRRRLVEKWSKPAGDAKAGGRGGEGGGRILYVVSSFDRGRRLGRSFRGVDKMDYVLMMVDEMREACEIGFSPQMHFIAAWDPTEVSDLVRDRLFCARIGGYIPYSHEQHNPRIGNLLSIKHRIYMKTRLDDFDLFIQVEDDMILTLNHILLYLEESDKLAYRRGSKTKADYHYLPGFMRIEPGAGMGEEGIGEEWFEWEITLSRFRAMKVTGAGTYMALGGSSVLKRGGNNQGMWMATQGQLRHLKRKCKYLDFSEDSVRGHVETHSGSIQMFQICGIEKVFPATRFEGFLIHHRTNNKNGRRGESIPAVPMSMLRVWAGQFLRDAGFLEVHNRRRLRR